MDGRDFLALVDQVAVVLPGVPRLAVFDAVDAEWVRLRAAVEPCLAPVVVAAAVRRLRQGAAAAQAG